MTTLPARNPHVTIRPANLVTGHPRFFVAIAVAALAYVATAHGVAPPARNVISWDAGASVYLAGLAIMFARSAADAMPRNAERQREGEWTIFCVTLGAVVFSFTAVLDAMAGASHLPAPVVRARVILVAATLLLSWLLTQTVFAMRYAHEYYERRPDGSLKRGLQFPGEAQPDYWDFMYFGIVLGMTFQVSDVQITDRGLRRLAAVHGFLGFLFNTVIIAFTVNLAAALV